MTNIIQIGAHRVLPVMATQAEYGPALKTRFLPFICGVGPVEAAVNLSRVLVTESADYVVSLGSAGSASLPQGSVHLVSSVAYRDMDASPLGFEKGVTPFADIPAVLELSASIVGLTGATLSTGGNIISGDAYTSIKADLVDMESWAIVRACQSAGARFIGLRGVSDGAEPLTGFADWADYLQLVDGALATAWDHVVAHLETAPE